MSSGETFQRVLRCLKDPQVLDRDAQIVVRRIAVPAFTFYKAFKVADAGICCTPIRDFWDESLATEVLEVGMNYLEEADNTSFVTRKLPFEFDNEFDFDTLVLVGPRTHGEFEEEKDLHDVTALIYPLSYCEVTGEETESEWEFILRDALDPADWQRSRTKKEQGRNLVPFHRVKFDVPYYGCDSTYRLARWPWTEDLIQTVFSEQEGWVAVENVDGQRVDVSPCDGAIEFDRSGADKKIVGSKKEAVESTWSFITPTRVQVNQRASQDSERAERERKDGQIRLVEQVGDSLRTIGTHGGFVVLRGKTYYVQVSVQKGSQTTASFEVVSDSNLDESDCLSESQRSELKQRGFTLDKDWSRNWEREIDVSSPENAHALAAEAISILVDLFDERGEDIKVEVEEDCE